VIGCGPGAMASKLFIMGPHTKDFYHPFFFQNLINQAMLNVNAPGVSPRQISNEFMEWWGTLERVFLENFQHSLRLEPKTGRS
jgi:hypothetical protein